MDDERPVEIVAPTSRENVHVRAMRALVEGRVGIEVVRPGLVKAWVRCQHAHVHHVTWDSDRAWLCDCDAARSSCYHVAAVQRVIVLPDDAPDRPPWPTMPG